MKRILAILLTLFVSAATFSQDDLVHSTVSCVDDYAGIISADEIASIDAKIRSLKEHTTVETSIVTVNSLNDKSIEDFTRELGNRWGVGGKSNNGLIILIAPNERKWRIEVGPGLQGDLPDVTTKDMGDRIFPPYFKQQQYGQGISDFMDEVILSIDPVAKQLAEAEAAKQAEIFKKNARAFGSFLWKALCFVAFVVLIGFFVRRYQKAKAEKAKYLQNLLSSLNVIQGNAASTMREIDQMREYNPALKEIYEDLAKQTRFISSIKIETLKEDGLETIRKEVNDLRAKAQDQLVRARNWKNAKDTLLKIPSIITSIEYDYKQQQRSYGVLLDTAPDLVDKSWFENLAKEKAATIADLIQLQAELKSAIESEKDSKFNSLISRINSAQSKYSSKSTTFASNLSDVQRKISYVNSFEKDFKNKIAAHKSIVDTKQYVSHASRNSFVSAIPDLLAVVGGIALAATITEKLAICKRAENSFYGAASSSTSDIAKYEQEQREIARRKKEKEEQEARERRAREEQIARERRQREEQEESERRQRNSYSSSSYSSSYSSSSNDDSSSSSFGGGSFDGGGSSGGW